MLVGTVLDMLLPSGRMQGLVRLVAGIFIMVAVLNPLMVFLQQSDWAHTLGPGALPQVSAAGYEEIRREGEALREHTLAQAWEEARVRLERQIEAMAGLKNGVAGATAKVIMATGQGQGPAIERIWVRLRAEQVGEPAGEPVSPVTVGSEETAAPAGAGPGEDRQAAIATQLVKTLTGFYGVSAEQVQVIWE
ncbi:MAG: stage III sporulation protein AF [Heliobacteriaceae bacterium]|nr:stage III sporulation protein AF [Heliobacteriaceae bacterium]